MMICDDDPDLNEKCKAHKQSCLSLLQIYEDEPNLNKTRDANEQNCVLTAVADEDGLDPHEVLRADAPRPAARAVLPPRQHGSHGAMALEDHERATRHGRLQEVQRQGQLGHEGRQRRRWLRLGGC